MIFVLTFAVGIPFGGLVVVDATAQSADPDHYRAED